MKALSKLAQSVRASTTIEIDTKYKQMKADGIDVIGFGTGEPDFDTPEHIKQAGIRAIENNQTRYTPAAGTMDVRKAAAYRLKEDWGVEYAPEEIAVTGGPKHILYVILKTLVNPGDEVILPAPYWVTYYEAIKMVGGVPVILETTAETGLKITPELLKEAICPETKAIILNNPSNPSGIMYTKEELEALAQVCVEGDIYIIADEIYDKLVYDNKEFVSIPSLGEEIKERTILVNGVSKSYAMTGWRIGYAAGPKHIIKIISNYLSHCMSGTSGISQAAAIQALTGPQDEVEAMRQEFQTRRDYMYARIENIPGVSALMPQGAFYMFMNIDGLIGKKLYGVPVHDADDFANLFLEKGLVAVVPGTGFGAPNYVRWSYATSMENIEKGMDRLEAFLDGAQAEEIAHFNFDLDVAQSEMAALEAFIEANRAAYEAELAAEQAAKEAEAKGDLLS
ncbi:MAG: pyridoxal phosphate-dependent aminotransferase [Ruminiclostridium sp.]|nr:pyridoxal phosphate-dependent aminotransferase [Ruminiclostridium sp.]